MTDIDNKDTEQELDGLVKHKVQKRVAIKVMRDIHRQVDEIGRQEQIEQRGKNLLIPLLILLTASVIGLIVFWTGALRLLSGLID